MQKKFGEILHLDKSGTIIDLQRLHSGTDVGIQPVMLVKDTKRAQILMRNATKQQMRRTISLTTQNGGRNWSAPTRLPLLNPNSALTAVVLSDGRILAVVNNQLREGISKGRDALALMISTDEGKSWRMVYRLEDQLSSRKNPLQPAAYLSVARRLAKQTEKTLSETEANAYAESAQNALCHGSECTFEFSYPYLIQTKDGSFHLAYTWNRSFIKYVHFNLTWIEQCLQK